MSARLQELLQLLFLSSIPLTQTLRRHLTRMLPYRSPAISVIAMIILSYGSFQVVVLSMRVKVKHICATLASVTSIHSGTSPRVRLRSDVLVHIQLVNIQLAACSNI